jgi:hypothetical protein
MPTIYSEVTSEKPPFNELEAAVDRAMSVIETFGATEGAHHQAWVIDQVARELLGWRYAQWVRRMKEGEDGPETYDWAEGIAP